MNDFIHNGHGWCSSHCICGSKLTWHSNGTIKTNIFTDGKTSIPGLYELTNKCHNPACEWSTIDEETYDIMDDEEMSRPILFNFDLGNQ